MDNRYRYRPREDVRIDGFNAQVDELLETGINSLAQLQNQRETFRSIERRFAQIGSNLGMSSTVMRLIRRRSYTDRLILFGGMIAFTIFMIIVYIYYL